MDWKLMQNIDILFRLNCFPTFHAQSDVLKWSATIILHFTSLISWYHRGIIKDMATTFLHPTQSPATLCDSTRSMPVQSRMLFYHLSFCLSRTQVQGITIIPVYSIFERISLTLVFRSRAFTRDWPDHLPL